jgi:hypothetical protein
MEAKPLPGMSRSAAEWTALARKRREDARARDAELVRLREEVTQLRAALESLKTELKLLRPCPHPARGGEHELYLSPDGPDGTAYCRACGAGAKP